MKWLKRILLSLIALVVLFAIVSQFLPGTYRVERTVVVKAPAEKVFPQFADLRQWKAWGVWWERDPGMTVTYSDPPTGVGSWSNWISKKEGSGKMTVKALEPDKSMNYDLFFPDFGMTSTGSMALSPADGGVKVTWISSGELGRNPMSRWFGLFLGGMIGKDFDSGLARLKANCEKS
jgi:uncharacterized protein YndB with AHSA1/START domain